MGSTAYEIRIEDFRLEERIIGPVLHGVGPKNGCRLYRRRYHVTVVPQEGDPEWDRTLIVDQNYKCKLGKNGEEPVELDGVYLSKNRFIFVGLEDSED